MADTMNVFCIVHGGDELYYQANADFNATLWAGLADDEPYQKLTAIGKRIDAGRAAEIQQSGNCDYDITFDYDAYTVKVEHYAKHYTQSFNMSELARVANALNEFSEDEFDNQTTFETLDNVGLVYSTITDFEIPLQVSVDLVNCKVKYYLDEFPKEDSIIAKVDDYDNLSDLAEDIENSSFDDWLTVYDLPADKICEYLEKNIEKIKMYTGTECFVIGKWTDTGIDGDIPVEFMIGAEYNSDKKDFDYCMQAYITDGYFKGYYLGEDIYDRSIIKQDAFLALLDKINGLALDKHEREADPNYRYEQERRNRFVDSFGRAYWYYACDIDVIDRFEHNYYCASDFPLLAKSYYDFKNEYEYETISGEDAFDFVVSCYKDVMQSDDKDNYYTVEDNQKMFSAIYGKQDEIIDFIKGFSHNNPLEISQEELDLTEQEKGRS